jgi:hypothetical protein
LSILLIPSMPSKQLLKNSSTLPQNATNSPIQRPHDRSNFEHLRQIQNRTNLAADSETLNRKVSPSSRKQRGFLPRGPHRTNSRSCLSQKLPSSELWFTEMPYLAIMTMVILSSWGMPTEATRRITKSHRFSYSDIVIILGRRCILRGMLRGMFIASIQIFGQRPTYDTNDLTWFRI